MENGTFTMAGHMAFAGAARPRSGQSLDVCAWTTGVSGPKPANQMVTDITTHLTRRLQESSP